MSGIKKLGIVVAIMLLILLITLAVLAPTIKDYYIKSKLVPEAELTSAIENMAKATSYQYYLKSGFRVDDRREVISEVTGEKVEENTHIKGEMVNTPVDIYYIDCTIYNYDAFSEKWLVIDSNTTNSEELLITELSPLSNFKFREISEVEKLGFENIDGTECLVVMCKPVIDNEFLESMWQDFAYEMWIDYKGKIIKKAILTANNRQMPSTKLDIQVEFDDINGKLKVEPPI